MNDLRERYDFLFDGSGDPTQETLLLYVFGPLESEARLAVEQHLEACEMCRDAAEGLALLGTKEQALAALAATDAQLLARVEALKQKVTRDGREVLINQAAAMEPPAPKAGKHRQMVWYRYAVAASLLVVVGTAFWLFNQNMGLENREMAMTNADLPSTTGAEAMANETSPATTDPIVDSVPANGNAARGGSVPTTLSAPLTTGQPIVAAENPNLTVYETKKTVEVTVEETNQFKDEVTTTDQTKDKEAPTEDLTISQDEFKREAPTLAAPTTVNKGSSNTNNFNYSNVAGMDAALGEAQYPGGSTEVQKYFDKVVYPADVAKGYKGVVTFEVSFDKKGKITSTKLVDGLGEPYDKLLLDHLKKMPNWIAPQPFGEPIASTRLVAVEVMVK